MRCRNFRKMFLFYFASVEFHPLSSSIPVEFHVCSAPSTQPPGTGGGTWNVSHGLPLQTSAARPRCRHSERLLRMQTHLCNYINNYNTFFNTKLCRIKIILHLEINYSDKLVVTEITLVSICKDALLIYRSFLLHFLRWRGWLWSTLTMGQHCPALPLTFPHSLWIR